MGLTSSQPEADKAFLHESCHKTYVVTASHMDFIKIGYTQQPILNGVWSIYRRAYGEDLEIIRIYPASHYKEDDRIHAKLHEQYGIPNKGQEIYHKKYKKDLIRELDEWHEGEGVGPFKRVDILTMKQKGREAKKASLEGGVKGKGPEPTKKEARLVSTTGNKRRQRKKKE